ncbi:MAG: molybdate ABC transporter substrate-binding protein [Azoarcus sp.]|nr:molybdate ABC transporter substrate-binding protein [Azoarcus sp.]
MRRLLALALLLSAAALQAAEIRVAVAANFQNTLQQLAALYAERSGHRLAISAGASGALYTQIVNGAPFDVFLSADTERPARLEAEGHGVDGTRFVYAYGVLVLWSARPGVVDANGAVLERGDYRFLAIADPRLAPYGLAAEQVLRERGVFGALDGAGRLVRGKSIGQTYGQIASGAAELGFVALAQVQASDIAGSRWLPPPDMYTPIGQSAVLLTRAAQPDAARDFLAWLRSPEARAVIEQAGYRLD